jgi:hypothetical protein
VIPKKKAKTNFEELVVPYFVFFQPKGTRRQLENSTVDQ